MKDKEEVINYLVKRYGYKKGVQPSIFSIVINKRINKALREFDLFIDTNKEEKLSKLRLRIIELEKKLNNSHRR